MNPIRILGVEITDVSPNVILTPEFKGVVFTPNVDHLIRLNKDEKFFEVYKESNWRLCDSQIVRIVARLLGRRIQFLNTGSDIFPSYCRLVAGKKLNEKRVFILGGSTTNSAMNAASELMKNTETNFVVGFYSPPFGFENDETEILKIIDLITTSGANVLAVGVGSPKQEFFISSIKDRLKEVDLFFAIGATVDFISGFQRRAPRFMQKLALEWLYRFIKEPKRMFRRYFIYDIQFFYLIFKESMGWYRNPFEIERR
jgi:exopolysaccharide biosynthesis WecB/TagA/CpsF family protein